MSPRTEIGALDAEMLSEIGKIKQEIEQLTKTWAAAAKAASSPCISSISAHTLRQKRELTEYVDAEKARILATIDEQLAETVKLMARSIDDHNRAVEDIRSTRQIPIVHVAIIGLAAMGGAALGTLL